MTIVESTQATLDADLRDALPVLLMFTAPWCGPCRAQYPHVERFATEFEGRIKVMRINIDEAPETCRKFGIRAVPQMVFCVDGNEYAQLNERTATRMSLTANRWLDELGMNIDRNTRQSVTENNRVWCSFGGDAAMKVACIARLQEVANADLHYLSDCLAGGPDRFESVIGAPAALGELLDSIHEYMRWRARVPDDCDSMTGIRARLLEIVEAMPVGADLRSITPELLSEFVYHSAWTPTPHFTGPAAVLNTRIKELHEQECAGIDIAASTWKSLRQDAVRLGQSNTQFASAADMLEALASPCADWIVGDIMSGLINAACDELSFPEFNLTARDHIRAAAMEEHTKIDDELGEPPEGRGEARAIWNARYRQLCEMLKRQHREAQPESWKAFDRWNEHYAATAARLGGEVANLLLQKLRVYRSA